MRRTLGCLNVLVLSVSLFVFARPAEAAISLKNSAVAQNKGGTAATTLPIGPLAVVAGDLAVVVFDDLVGGAAPTIADNLVNTWTPLQAWNGSVRMSAWYSSITVAGSMTVTVSFGSSANARAGVLGIFTGASASPLDKNPIGTADSASPYVAPLSGVLAQADEVVIGLFGLNGPDSDTTAATSPDLMVGMLGTGGGGPTTNAKALMTYRVVSATTSVAPQMTDTTNRAGTVGTATFKAQVLSNFLVEAAPGGGPIGTQTAGTPFNIKITARDQFNNTFTGFTGTVAISSTGTLSGGTFTSGAFASGVLASTSVTILNTGSFTLTATKTAGTETGTSNAFTVSPGALNNFLVEAAVGGSIGTQTAGVPFSIKITARDANNNTVTGFTGPGNTVDITSTGTLSAGGGTTAAFTAGVLTSTSVTISNTGSFTITATKTAGTETGTSNAFTVTAGALANFLVESATASNWYAPAGWNFRKKITIDNAKVGSGGVSNFPVLILRTDTDLQSNAQANGNDILFTSSDGTSKLSHEIERYVSATGALVAWVKVPSISSSSPTDIYMYYGNASAANQQDTVSKATWDANYKSVWHLPDGTTLTASDSTINANNGTLQFAPTATTGQMDGGGSFVAASGQYISTANSFADPQDFTVSAWFKTSTASGAKIVGFETNQISTVSGSYDRHIYMGTDGKIRFGWYSGVTNEIASTSTLTDGLWHHAVGTHTSGNVGTLYIDGVLQGTGSNAAQGMTGYWRIGSYKLSGWTSGVDGYFTGGIDEVRVSDVARSAAWITTEYNNQSSPSTFYSVAAAVAVTDTGGNIGTQTAGAPFNIKITARDANNNTVTGFTGTVTITSTGTLSAGSGTTAAFTTGVLATHSVTISNTGSFTITATKTAGTEAGTSNAFTVNPGVLNNFLVEAAGGGAIGTQTAGTAFSIKITARDANNNTLSAGLNTFTGTVTITSTGTLSAGGGTTAAFTAGVLTLTGVTISNTGTFTITATKTAGTETGTSNAFTVNPGALANFLVEAAGGGAIGTQTAGVAFSIKITARDAFNNTVTGFTGTVTITSTGTLSAGGGTTVAFTAGVLTLTGVTISNTGSFTLTATKTAGTETGTSNAFTVNAAGALNNFLVEAATGGSIGTQTAGTAFSIKITARDANNTTVTSFTGTVNITSTGTLSLGGGTTAAFTAGVLTPSVTISNTGTFTLTATKTAGAETGTSNAFTVNPTCGSVADASYAAASGTSTQVTLYWSSANPVLILRESGGSVTGTPVGATTYSVGNPIGTSTVVYSGSVAEKSFLDTGQTAGRTTTDRYKVYVKGAGCYSPGLQVDASPSGTAWGYARSDGPLLKPGIAGAGALYIGGNGSKITSLSTADGTQSWDPVASTGAIQGWLTWLPVGGDVATGLVGHWKFDDGSGSPTAADSSGNGNTGTLVSGPTWATGKVNGGLSFDGVDDYVDAGNPSTLQLTGAMTIAAWVYDRATGMQAAAGRRIVSKMGFSGDRGWDLTLESGDNMCFYIAQNATTLLSVCSINPTPLFVWVHWVGVYEPGVALRLYKNGVLDNSNTTGIPSSQYNSSLNVRFGRRTVSASGQLDGIIDDVRVYNRALSAAEVSKLHLRGGAWPYRKKITVDKTKVAGPLTDFPVLISRTNDQDLKSKAQASGNDILFTAADGETKLSHEIEKYDPSPPTGATLVAWVKVPSVSSTANTDIYMYYGDAGASDQQDTTGVWSNGYAGVWHLKESPSGAAGEMKDSTSNANHGTSFGGMTSANQVPGKIGGGLDFDGTDDYLNVGSGASLRPSAAITISAWMYRRDDRVPVTTSEQDTIVRSSELITGNYFFGPIDFFGTGPADSTEFGFGVGATGATMGSTDPGPLGLNTWHYVAATYVSGGSSQAMYWNGNAMTLFRTDTDAIPTNIETVFIGGHSGVLPADNLNGFLDEVRISNVARSAAWITTEYNNQSSPSTFYSVGGEAQVTGAAGAQQTVIGGDQSGRVYSLDAAAGFKHWGDTAALTGTNAVQAGVSAQVRAWSNSGPGSFQATYTDDVIFAATWNASATSNKVFALGGSNGAVLWTFQDAVNGVDYIAGQPYVDYARNRIYVVSRAGLSSNQQSLWVIKTVDGELVSKGQAMACPACTNVPATGGLKGVHFETSPTLSYDGNTLYIGDTAGKLYAINAGALTLKWTLDLGAGVNIKTSGFVWEDYTTAGRLYFVTADGNVRCVQDNGGSGSACTGWTVFNVPGASTPLLLNKLFVGSSDGKVHQINITPGVDFGKDEKQFPAATSLDGTPLGAISTETGNEIFVGTSGGKIFKINLTLGALP